MKYASLELLHGKWCQINTLYHLNDKKIKVQENDTHLCVILPNRSSLPTLLSLIPGGHTTCTFAALHFLGHSTSVTGPMDDLSY